MFDAVLCSASSEPLQIYIFQRSQTCCRRLFSLESFSIEQKVRVSRCLHDNIQMQLVATENPHSYQVQIPVRSVVSSMDSLKYHRSVWLTLSPPPTSSILSLDSSLGVSLTSSSLQPPLTLPPVTPPDLSSPLLLLPPHLISLLTPAHPPLYLLLPPRPPQPRGVRSGRSEGEPRRRWWGSGSKGREKAPLKHLRL